MIKHILPGQDALLNASAILIAPGATTLDPNGIQLYEWSHPPKERGDCCGETFDSRYGWCACFALAQIESRIGIASFTSVVARHVLATVAAWATSIGTLVWVFTVRDFGQLYFVTVLITMAAVLHIIARWLVQRTAGARATVRERFQIPGTVQEDYKLTPWQSARMMRQMVRHLKLQDVGTFGRVDTLPAYAH